MSENNTARYYNPFLDLMHSILKYYWGMTGYIVIDHSEIGQTEMFYACRNKGSTCRDVQQVIV